MSEEKKAEIEQLLCLAPLPEVERGFRRTIYAASTRKDGDWMLYTNDRHVIMRRLDDPKISKIFSEHKHKATVARMSPNGNWVASGDSTGKVHVWGPSNFSVKNTVEVCSSVIDIDWDSESKKVLAVGRGADCLGKVFPFDASNNVGVTTNHTKAIISCSIKPTRPFKVATGGEDLGVNFYDCYPVKYNQGCEKHTRYPNTVAFSPDGNHLISAGADNKIVVYDAKTGEVTREIEDKEKGHKGAVYCAHWSPDSKQILTASADKTAKIWDFESGAVVTTFTVSAKPTINDMQMAALWFKNYIITVSLSGAINYWDPASPDAPTQVIEGHAAKILGMAVNQTSKEIYTSDQLGNVSVWKDGVAKWLAGKGHEKAIVGLALSADKDILYSIGMDDKLRANECKSAEFNTDATALGGSPKGLAAGKKDNSLCVVVLAQQKIVVTRGGKVVSTLDVSYRPTSVAINADDTEVMVGGKDKKAHFYSLSGDALKETRVDETHVKDVTFVSYSPQGHSVSASADFAIRLCDDKGELQNNSCWEFHTSSVSGVAFNPSGSRAISVANDLQIILWKDCEKFTTKRSTEKNAQMDSIDNVGWLDDKTFVTTAGDTSIKIWQANV